MSSVEKISTEKLLTRDLSADEKKKRDDLRDLILLLLLLFLFWLMWQTFFGRGGGGGGDIIIIESPVMPDFYYKHFFRHLGPSDTFDNMNASNNFNNVY